MWRLISDFHPSILNKWLQSTEGRLCLQAAWESEKQRAKNQMKADGNRDKMEKALNFLGDHRKDCELRGVGYYDSFRLQKNTEDFNANLKRLELAGLFDEITEMLKQMELPDGFEGRPEWVALGTEYRRLVEPLDFANYYRHAKNEDTGPYMIKGGPIGTGSRRGGWSGRTAWRRGPSPSPASGPGWKSLASTIEYFSRR